MFLKRSYQKEIMDDFSITDERINYALKELSVINKFLGGNSTTRKGLKLFLNKHSFPNQIKILDVGAGGSDNFKIGKFFDGNVEICSFDINKGVCRYTNHQKLTGNVICGDVFYLPFKDSSFDIIHASLFLHHFNEEEINELLEKFLKISRYGIIINDLQRSIFALMGIKLLTFFFSRSKMVQNDGPLSVRRGFIKNELKKILSKINFNYSIRYRWAFRWLAVITK
ncbi:MAG: methyltransferase domain-containing protein [Ignavibacteriales bacterium]|nr:methyltransferase domain-containing protein [Ignavibacteriales bacterium]